MNNINLNGASENIVLFFNNCLKELKEHNVDIIVSNESQVNTREDGTGLNCSGFFEDRPRKRLAIAIGKPLEDWLPIFVHEYSHFTQYRDDSSYWNDIYTEYNGELVEATAVIDRWLDGECELDSDSLNDLVRRAQQVERDCERRTVELIKKHNLPIDIEEYSQKANAYTEFYTVLKETRQWYPSGEAPYQVESVWSNAPKTAMAADDKAPEELIDALRAFYKKEHSKKLSFN